MNENGGKNNAILLTVIGIATLLVVVTGATFAYFAAITTGDDTATSVYIKAATEVSSTEVSGGDKIELVGIYPKADAWATQDFSVKYPAAEGASDTVKQKTQIDLVVLENTFKAGYITVQIKNNTTGDSATYYSETDTKSTNADGTTQKDYEVPTVATGVEPQRLTLVTGERQRNKEVTISYTLSIFFPEKDENQNDGLDHRVEMHLEDNSEG